MCIRDRLITFNPMQYVKLRGRKQETDIFSDSKEDTASIPTITDVYKRQDLTVIKGLHRRATTSALYR